MLCDFYLCYTVFQVQINIGKIFLALNLKYTLQVNLLSTMCIIELTLAYFAGFI